MKIIILLILVLSCAPASNPNKKGTTQKAKFLDDLFTEFPLSQDFIDKHCSKNNKKLSELSDWDNHFTAFQKGRKNRNEVNTIFICPSNRRIKVRECKDSNSDLIYYYTQDVYSIVTYKLRENVYSGKNFNDSTFRLILGRSRTNEPEKISHYECTSYEAEKSSKSIANCSAKTIKTFIKDEYFKKVKPKKLKRQIK